MARLDEAWEEEGTVVHEDGADGPAVRLACLRLSSAVCLTISPLHNISDEIFKSEWKGARQESIRI